MRPAKRPDEEWDKFLERLGEWETTTEGLDTCAKDRLAQLATIEKEHGAHRKKVLTDAGIPERYWFMDVESPHETEGVKALSGELGGLVVLSGSIGCGKTAAACWWASRVEGGKFITAGRMSRISKWGDEVVEMVKASRLVIDDLGVEFSDEKGFFNSLLDDVLNERYSRKRPTVITTNLQGPLFASRYKGRIVDRVAEFDGFISLSGGTLRGAKQLGLLPAADGVHT